MIQFFLGGEGGRGGVLAIDFDELSYYFAVWNTGRRLEARP